MEQYSQQNEESSLFGFAIDQSAKAHLAEAAKWAKFLAIVGFVMCGLLVILSFFIGTVFSSMGSYSDYESSGLGVFVTVLYLGIGVLYFFPCLFLFRFAINMTAALNANDQLTLNRAFQNLKIMFRFVGILTIIVLSLYILAFVFGMLGAFMR
jgi:Family of unknown function (DUF5362)